MQFSNISIIHSFSQTSLQDQVSIINNRLREAQNRLKNLNLKDRSSMKRLPKNTSMFTQQFDTKRSSVIHQMEFRKQNNTANIIFDNSKEQKVKQQIRLLEESFQRQKQSYLQKIRILEEQVIELRIVINQLQEKEVERQRQTKKNNKKATDTNFKLEELKQLINNEMQKFHQLDALNKNQKRKIEQLTIENSQLLTQIEKLSRQQQTTNHSKFQNQSESQSISVKDTHLSYVQHSESKINLRSHHKQCLMLCQFTGYLSEVLNKLKLSEIPAIVVMIREQLCLNLSMVNKISDRVKMLCPGLELDPTTSWKKRDGLTGRRFISGDQKQNIDLNSVVNVEQMNKAPANQNILCQNMMEMLLSQAQVIEKFCR